MDNERVREKHFDEHNAELNKRELSNAENFDKSVLTYSSAGLAFSLAFLKDFLPITRAIWGWLLYASWGLFTLAIIITIASYIMSQLGIKKERERSRRYYLEKEEKAKDEKNIFIKLTEKLNYSSGIVFVLAVIATTLFVSINLGRATKMTDQNKVVFGEAAPIPTLQKTEEAGAFKAAPIPTMQHIARPEQPAPQQQTSQQPQPAQESSPKGGNKE